MAKMTQKNYDLIAEVFYLEMVQLNSVKQADYWRGMVSAMANRLESTYDNFDRDKFLTKAGAR